MSTILQKGATYFLSCPVRFLIAKAHSVVELVCNLKQNIIKA